MNQPQPNTDEELIKVWGSPPCKTKDTHDFPDLMQDERCTNCLFWEAIRSRIAVERAEAVDEGWEACEKQKPVSLVTAITFRQEQYGWNDSKMAAMLDLSKSHYSEFKSGRRGLPVNSIRKAYAIGVPASSLLSEQLERQAQEEKHA